MVAQALINFIIISGCAFHGFVLSNQKFLQKAFTRTGFHRIWRIKNVDYPHVTTRNYECRRLKLIEYAHCNSLSLHILFVLNSNWRSSKKIFECCDNFHSDSLSINFRFAWKRLDAIKFVHSEEIGDRKQHCMM